MIKYFKPITLLIMLCLCSLISVAQQEQRGDEVADFPLKSEPKFARILVGVNGGLAILYGDVKPHKTSTTFGLDLGYYASPYLLLNLNAQKGTLQAGDVAMRSAMMGTKGDYWSGALSARFMPVALMNYFGSNLPRFLNEIYGGIGLGYMSFNVESNKIISPDYGSLEKYSGSSFIVPVEVGFNLPVAKFKKHSKLMLTFNYKSNLCFTDNIDGYVPTVIANRKNDAYNTLTGGLAFVF